MKSFSKTIGITIFASFLLVVSGCEETENTTLTQNIAATEKQKKSTVKTYTVEEKNTLGKITVHGNLYPQTEAIVAAEASGVVQYIPVEEGDEVGAGTLLLKISGNDNLAAVEINAAQAALRNAQKNLLYVQNQANETKKQLDIAISRAEIQLKNATETHVSVEKSTDAKVAAAQSMLSLAQLQYQNAQKRKEEIADSVESQKKTLEEQRENTIAAAMVTFRQSILFLDDLLGVSDEKKKLNDNFEGYLGFKDPQTKIDAVQNFRQTRVNFLDMETAYYKKTRELTEEDLKNLAEQIRESLLQTDIMLEKSVANGSFTESILAEKRNSAGTHRANIERAISSLTTSSRAWEDFLIQSPQTLRAATFAVEQAREQVVEAEKNLANAKSGGNVEVIGSSSASEDAQKALKIQKAQKRVAEQKLASAVQQAIAARDAAQAQVNAASVQYDKLNITAPFSGVITKKHVDSGSTISLGTPLFTIAQSNILILKTDVSLRELALLKKGMNAEVEIEGFGTKQGVLSKIYPEADSVTRRVNIEIRIENPERKIPSNIFATANIELPSEEKHIFLPVNALVSQENPTVFVAEKDEYGAYHATRKAVEIGEKNENQVEIISGLRTGEKVILENVQEGEIIKIEE